MDGLIVHCSIVPVKTGKKKNMKGRVKCKTEGWICPPQRWEREGGREEREREGRRKGGREGGEGTNQFTWETHYCLRFQARRSWTLWKIKRLPVSLKDRARRVRTSTRHSHAHTSTQAHTQLNAEQTENGLLLLLLNVNVTVLNENTIQPVSRSKQGVLLSLTLETWPLIWTLIWSWRQSPWRKRTAPFSGYWLQAWVQ